MHNHIPSTTTIILSLFGLSLSARASAVAGGGGADKALQGVFGLNVAAITPPPGLLPRYGSMNQPGMVGMNPKGWSYIGKPGLSRRQNIENSCNPGEHSCEGLNQDGCCKNTHYCFVDNTGLGLCCPLGSKCNQDPCDTSSFFCTSTTALTPTGTITDMITTVTSGCCLRACSLTFHSCAQVFGGNCCGNESACIPGNLCTRTPGPSTTSDTCAPGSTSCAVAEGGGCCPDGFQCTNSGTNAGCAPTNGGPTNTRSIFTDIQTMSTDIGDLNPGPTDRTDPGTGLSSGAKIGIGVGVGVAALAILALGVFFVLRHRNKSASDGLAQNSVPGYQPPPQQPPVGQVDVMHSPIAYNSPNSVQAPGAFYPHPNSPPPPVQAGYYDPTKVQVADNRPHSYVTPQYPNSPPIGQNSHAPPHPSPHAPLPDRVELA